MYPQLNKFKKTKKQRNKIKNQVKKEGTWVHAGPNKKKNENSTESTLINNNNNQDYFLLCSFATIRNDNINFIEN